MRWSFVAFLVMGCTASVDGPIDERRCSQLRDHLVELQIQDIHVATGIDRAAHRQAMTQALGTDFVTSCTKNLTESQVDCALDTKDRAAAAACAR